MKTFHELNEAFPSLLDENGNRKTFERFLNDVQSIDETYNRNYLRAEYNFVHQSAQMAAKWEHFAEDGDRYYLQYRTAGDDKVRPEHAALNRVTLPMSDPFWETYYPPNGWNCFTSYTPVLTANGWKRIASIKKGDLVVGGSGKLREVTATLARPFKGDLVTIVTKGAKATCTPNHRFCTRRGWVAAEDLHEGDIIIQVGEQSALHLLVHTVGNAYTILRYGLMACVRKRKAIAALAIYYKPKAGDKEVDHIPSEKLTLLEQNAHCNEVTAHDFFALAHWCAQCAHPLWMKFAGGKRPLGRLLSYIRSEKRRGKLQLFRYATNEAAVRLRLALAHMKTLGRKLAVRLGNPSGRFCTSGIVIGPLGSDSIAAMPDRDSQLIEDTMHGSVVDSPMDSEPSEAPLFGGIPEFCGIEDIHAFDGFHSFFDFLRNTFLHNRYVLVEDKVTKKKRELTVFNLSISGDESYIVPIGIAHNCRCTVVQVLKWKYDKPDSKEAMDRGKEALDGERFNIFRFNSGKQQKAVPDYNPYTIRRCNDCDIAKGDDNTKLVSHVPDNEACAACKIIRCMNAPYSTEKTARGEVRVHSKHGKNERAENVRIASYLANKHGYAIDLLPQEQRHQDADTYNKTLGCKQEYKVNSTPTASSIDSLLRKAKKQADNIVLSVESDIPLGTLKAAIIDRVRRSENIKSLTIVYQPNKGAAPKDATYTREEMIKTDFKIKREDFS